MKPKFKLVISPRMSPRRLRIVRKPVQLSVVTQAEDFKSSNEKPAQTTNRDFLTRCFKSFKAFLNRLDQLATQARQTDEQIRKMRAEHYSKYGCHFRDRI